MNAAHMSTLNVGVSICHWYIAICMNSTVTSNGGDKQKTGVFVWFKNTEF